MRAPIGDLDGVRALYRALRVRTVQPVVRIPRSNGQNFQLSALVLGMVREE